MPIVEKEHGHLLPIASTPRVARALPVYLNQELSAEIAHRAEPAPPALRTRGRYGQPRNFMATALFAIWVAFAR